MQNLEDCEEFQKVSEQIEPKSGPEIQFKFNPAEQPENDKNDDKKLGFERQAFFDSSDKPQHEEEKASVEDVRQNDEEEAEQQSGDEEAE